MNKIFFFEHYSTVISDKVCLLKVFVKLWSSPWKMHQRFSQLLSYEIAPGECFFLMIILDLLLENLFSIPASFCILGKAFWLFNFLFGIITIWIPISSVLKEKLVDWFPYDWLTRWQTFSSHGLMQVQINLCLIVLNNKMTQMKVCW